MQRISRIGVSINFSDLNYGTHSLTLQAYLNQGNHTGNTIEMKLVCCLGNLNLTNHLWQFQRSLPAASLHIRFYFVFQGRVYVLCKVYLWNKRFLLLNILAQKVIVLSNKITSRGTGLTRIQIKFSRFRCYIWDMIHQ